MFPEKTSRDRPPAVENVSVGDLAPEGAGRRDLVPVEPQTTNDTDNHKLGPSRLTEAMFLAHLFATKFKEPQTREKRRAEPGKANASYRKASLRPPARASHNLSKKI
jgi:hypothetical protein